MCGERISTIVNRLGGDVAHQPAAIAVFVALFLAVAYLAARGAVEDAHRLDRWMQRRMRRRQTLRCAERIWALPCADRDDTGAEESW
jgi:hypothetical protein